mmetsp:Transcript_9819/g.31606  ORF Transcript_9819/g.31606 Transcript_9819/m.31606 type:complete len:379 (+) Transcript_9819:100-1236(+)
MVKRVGKYEIGRTLGEGTFGKVKFAVNTETGENVAIKILDKDKIARQGMGEQIKKEIAVMKMVKQAHVVNLLEVLASRTRIFIVLELVTGGELFDKIVHCGRFDEDTARSYFRQLVCGVEYCHRQGVCHRDLKPENLLLDDQSVLKISDFGLSALYGCEGGFASSTLLHTTCGTPNYVAPEVLADKGYDGFAADVWSCGVVLFVLLAGFLPFDEPTLAALFSRITRSEYSFPRWFSSSVKELIASILVAEPNGRATIAQIKASDWFTHGGYRVGSGYRVGRDPRGGCAPLRRRLHAPRARCAACVCCPCVCAVRTCLPTGPSVLPPPPGGRCGCRCGPERPPRRRRLRRRALRRRGPRARCAVSLGPAGSRAAHDERV